MHFWNPQFQSIKCFDEPFNSCQLVRSRTAQFDLNFEFDFFLLSSNPYLELCQVFDRKKEINDCPPQIANIFFPPRIFSPLCWHQKIRCYYCCYFLLCHRKLYGAINLTECLHFDIDSSNSHRNKQLTSNFQGRSGDSFEPK